MTRAPTPRHRNLLRSATPCAAALAALLLWVLASTASAQSLRGSPVSLDRQDAAARRNDFTFIRTPAQLRLFVKEGLLVRVRPDDNLSLHGVSYPYARPEVAVFVRRLGAEYRAACGRKLVVTSLTRPEDRQPWNASRRSVHPTGMAVDLRYSSSHACRRWIERVLLSLEESGILEATRERYPPHYHVAVFPERYASYVQGLQQRQLVTADVAPSGVTYHVRAGDSLWTIAREHGTTVSALKDANDLRGDRIYAGQTLSVPSDQMVGR